MQTADGVREMGDLQLNAHIDELEDIYQRLGNVGLHRVRGIVSPHLHEAKKERIRRRRREGDPA